MFLSNNGRCIWLDNPFCVKIADGTFEFDTDEVSIETYGSCLRDAYIGAQKSHFRPTGETLPATFLKHRSTIHGCSIHIFKIKKIF